MIQYRNKELPDLHKLKEAKELCQICKEFNALFIVNDRLETNIPHIFAVGDVSNKVNLTPVAIDEGRVFADNNFGRTQRIVDYKNIPCAVFSQPEIASVGLTEEESIKEYGKDNIKIFRSSFRSKSK